MLRVLQERYVGEFQLPASVAIVAAANPPETAADGWDPAPVANRLMHLDWQFDAEDWDPAPVANRLMHLDWQFDAEEWLSGVLTSFQHTTMSAIDVMLGSEGTTWPSVGSDDPGYRRAPRAAPASSNHDGSMTADHNTTVVKG